MSAFVANFLAGFVIMLAFVAAVAAVVLGSMFALYWASGGELWGLIVWLVFVPTIVGALSFAISEARK